MKTKTKAILFGFFVLALLYWLDQVLGEFIWALGRMS